LHYHQPRIRCYPIANPSWATQLQTLNHTSESRTRAEKGRHVTSRVPSYWFPVIPCELKEAAFL
jgi:hypothetical protein